MSLRLIPSLAVALIAGTFFCASALAENDYSKSVGGYTLYLGVVPAEIIQGHVATHAEATMHGGAQTAGNSHHVMVSIMDDRPGKQVANATVERHVGEIGLSVTTRKLDPMPIAGATTYGNYFPMSGAGPFQIDVEFRPSGQTQTPRTRFYYTHPDFTTAR